MKKVLPIVAIVLLLSVIGYILFIKPNTEDYSYVLLKINPEVELGVDSNNIVKEVNPLNEDADVLISDMELIGKPIEDAAQEIIDSTNEIGKLENNIELVVMNTSEDTRLKLETKIKERIEAHLIAKKYKAVLLVRGVTDEMKTSADTYEISYGKMLLVSKAIELNPELKEEELVEMSVKDIQEYIKDTVEARREEFKQSKEELKEIWENKKAELKANKVKNSGDNTSESEIEETEIEDETTEGNRNQNGR